MNNSTHRESGASLLEVLVAVLILSFGLLAIGGMLSYAVQMPKLAAYRAAATSLGAGHIERMRANIPGFENGSYTEGMTYNTALAVVVPCAYPSCTATTIATLDKDETGRAIRRELPQGGIRVICNGACTNHEGDMWVMWLEPSTTSTLDPGKSDECPDPTVAPTFGAFADPKPRCLHIRFKL